ncbi:MAG: Tad domain-containing protein [bacterium]|jgi:hypothetical protein
MSPPREGERGSTLVFTAIAMVVILVVSAIAIDLGVIGAARSQLQNAMDASALAGASGLFDGQDKATQLAITFAGLNECMNIPVNIKVADVSFPDSSKIRVEKTQPIGLYFAKVIGIDSADIYATATAAIGGLSGTSRVKPWAIPDFDYVLGDVVLLKSGSSDPPSATSSFFYAVDFPPLNKGTPLTGANEYADNILFGSDGLIEIGDQLQVEPGNMQGPTKAPVEELIAMDPNATWNSSTNTIDNSDFAEFSSPRVCKISMYDPNFPPEPGKNYVTVVRLGAFFLEDIQPNGDVIGRFIEITTGGVSGPGDSDLYGVKLVQ